EDELLRHRQVEADLDVLMQGSAEGDESGGVVRGVFGGGQGDGGGLGGGCWVVGKWAHAPQSMAPEFCPSVPDRRPDRTSRAWIARLSPRSRGSATGPP